MASLASKLIAKLASKLRPDYPDLKDPLVGRLRAFVVPKAGSESVRQTIEADVRALVREWIGAVAGLSRVVVVERPPKTRSGKISRRTMKEIAEGGPFAAPATIEDASVLAEIERAWKE